MIDFNAHLLSGTNDGPETSEESYALLKELTSAGFSKIVCAPRYFPSENSYVSPAEKRKKIKELETAAKYAGTPVKLYLASEVFLIPNIDEMVQKKEISLLSRRNILIKLPERGRISLEKVEKVLIELREKGYVPILATPEKSAFLQEDEQKIDKLSGTGAMFQCGFGSIIGLNGKGAENLMKYMLQRGFCDFLGTDARASGDETVAKIEKSVKKIKKIIGEKGFNKIMRNAEGIL